MRVPIPEDWDGESWMCVKVQWPDSPMYWGLLAGLLTYLTRGRLYDERTGSIIAAQEIGKEIDRRNLPFRMCDSTQDPETGENGNGGTARPVIACEWLYEALDECEDEDMPSGPCPPIKIENGKLYWWQCCEWMEVGTLELEPQAPPDIPTEDPPSEYSPCGKVDAMAQAIATVAQAVWDNKDGPTYFLNIGAVDSSLPGFDLNNSGILSLLSGARSLDDTYTESEMLAPTYLQAWRCIAKSQVSGEHGYLTQSEYDATYALLASAVPAGLAAWYQGIMATIGKPSMSVIAESGAANTSADCSCPEPSVPSGFTEVVLQWDFSVFSPNTTVQHDVDLTGGTPLPKNWIAAVYEWEGLNAPNGEIKVFDQSNQVISNYSTGSGSFALYNNSNSDGQSYLTLFKPSVSRSAAADPSEYQDEIMTVTTSGNNVTVSTSGTLTLVYKND